MKDLLPLTEIDKIANGRSLLMLKALLPYLSAGDLRMPSMLIKLMELQNLATYYQHSSPGALSAMAKDPMDFMEILKDISCFCPSEMDDIMAQMQTAMEMLQAFQTIQDMSDSDLKNVFQAMNGGNENGESGMDE